MSEAEPLPIVTSWTGRSDIAPPRFKSRSPKERRIRRWQAMGYSPHRVIPHGTHCDWQVSLPCIRDEIIILNVVT
jgi:hypothetical protein